MQEIEVKAQVKNAEYLIEKLHSLGCTFSQSIEQRDRIFIPIGETAPIPAGINALRVREEGGVSFFTLKQPMSNGLDKLEKEVVVSDAQEMADICILLGYYEASHVYKKRQKCIYQDIEICLDEVEELGTFIEVEKKVVGKTDGQKIQEELFVFLQTLGITKEDRVFEGYDILIDRKKTNK
jgi:adenylate cyclase class 2